MEHRRISTMEHQLHLQLFFHIYTFFSTADAHEVLPLIHREKKLILLWMMKFL